MSGAACRSSMSGADEVADDGGRALVGDRLPVEQEHAPRVGRRLADRLGEAALTLEDDFVADPDPSPTGSHSRPRGRGRPG